MGEGEGGGEQDEDPLVPSSSSPPTVGRGEFRGAEGGYLFLFRSGV